MILMTTVADDLEAFRILFGAFVDIDRRLEEICGKPAEISDKKVSTAALPKPQVAYRPVTAM